MVLAPWILLLLNLHEIIIIIHYFLIYLFLKIVFFTFYVKYFIISTLPKSFFFKSNWSLFLLELIVIKICLNYKHNFLQSVEFLILFPFMSLCSNSSLSSRKINTITTIPLSGACHLNHSNYHSLHCLMGTWYVFEFAFRNNMSVCRSTDALRSWWYSRLIVIP